LTVQGLNAAKDSVKLLKSHKSVELRRPEHLSVHSANRGPGSKSGQGSRAVFIICSARAGRWVRDSDGRGSRPRQCAVEPWARRRSPPHLHAHALPPQHAPGACTARSLRRERGYCGAARHAPTLAPRMENLWLNATRGMLVHSGSVAVGGAPWTAGRRPVQVRTRAGTHARAGPRPRPRPSRATGLISTQRRRRRRRYPVRAVVGRSRPGPRAVVLRPEYPRHWHAAARAIPDSAERPGCFGLLA
jgi:hypothetical protein